VDNVTDTITITNKRGKVIGVDTFTKFEIRDAATRNLIATVNGSTFTESSSASDLKIIYGQNTQDPFSVDLLGSGTII
jgi:hypothetical protein